MGGNGLAGGFEDQVHDSDNLRIDLIDWNRISKGVESEEVERLQPGKGIFPEALDETKEGRVLNGAGKDEEDLMGSGAGEIRQRLGLADGLLDHDRWH